jgi:hypothetical protein
VAFEERAADLVSRFTPADVVNIADMPRLAKRRLPQVVFDYIDGGADDEVTRPEFGRQPS